MERAPLRPVPARPAGPVDPANAVRAVADWLPAAGPEAVQALALVVLAERSRADAAASIEVSERELGGLLAAARKELRQTLVALPGSGWCERAEALISDRLDGALADVEARRLDVHLRNCTRCVEHERRLVQATDALVLASGGRAGGAGPARGEAAPLVEAPAPEEPPAGGKDAPGEASGPATVPAPSPASGPAPAPVPTPAPAPADQIAEAAEVLVSVRARRQIAAAVAWNAMIVLAILLAVATIALTVAGIAGVQL